MSIGFDPIRICWSCLLDFVEESLIGQFIIHWCWPLTRTSNGASWDLPRGD